MTGARGVNEGWFAPSVYLTRREKIAAAVLRLLPIRNGKHRLLSSLMPHLGDCPAGDRSMPWASGSVTVDGSDLVGRQFLILGTFDPEVVEVLSFFADGTRDPVLWVSVAMKKSPLVARWWSPVLAK